MAGRDNYFLIYPTDETNITLCCDKEMLLQVLHPTIINERWEKNWVKNLTVAKISLLQMLL